MKQIKQGPNQACPKHVPFSCIEEKIEVSEEETKDTWMATERIPTRIDEGIVFPVDISFFKGQGSKEGIDHLKQTDEEKDEHEPTIGLIQGEARGSLGINKVSSESNEKHPKGKQNIELIIPTLYFIEVKEGEDDKTKAAKNDVFHEFPLFAVTAL